jgi:hypothetical protein
MKMFKWLESRILWGVLLIFLGVAFLVQNLFNLEIGGFFWGVILGLAGLFFLFTFINNREQWWALIPGFTLLGVSATIITGMLLPRVATIFGGAFILGGIGLAFVAVYFVDRRFWWAVIPAGVMLTLASITVLDQLLHGRGTGGVLFLGLGLTFAIVALIPTSHRTFNWAWIPAGVLFLMGVLISAITENAFGFVWPVILILGGGILIYLTLSRR